MKEILDRIEIDLLKYFVIKKDFSNFWNHRLDRDISEDSSANGKISSNKGSFKNHRKC